MLLNVLSILMVVFIVSSAIHGVISWVGRSLNNVDSKVEKYKAMFFGFHAVASLKKYMLPKYLASTIFFLWVRNVRFILLVFVSIFEYIVR